jgi:micrococcal nuclease
MPNKRLKFSKDLSRLVLTFLCFAIGGLGHESTWAKALERQSAVVREVLTGDSVRLEGGKVLKYAGVHAPPLQSLLPLIREYGENSLNFNKNLVEGKKIWVEWGSQIRDNQNNLLGYVFLEDGTFVNLELLKNGHAKAFTKAPNLKYSASFRKTELEARRKKLGLWKEEPDNPFLKSEYIGEKNTKVYYFPTSPELERFPEANLVKFRSRVEAKAAGYKPCFTCKENNKEEALY